MAEHNNNSSGNNLQSELLSFRQHWQEELKSDDSSAQQRRRRLLSGRNEEGDEPLTLEERATELFLEGARYEREGQLQVAVYYYRQAVHLVPDIEFKVAESKQKMGYYDDSSDDDEDGDGEDSSFELQQPECSINLNLNPTEMSLVDGVTSSFRLMNMSGLCAPETPQTTSHISTLPTELLSTLFRWVVSKDLDIKSLARCSLVCKWFYVCARDEEIWKLICLRVWGLGVGCEDLALFNNSWRHMYMERPHLRLNGVYISTNTYIHIGEPTVGSCYKPVHLVEYYKYLRFFADGSVILYTSPEDQQTVVTLLNQPPYRDPSVYRGYYRLTDATKVNIFYTYVRKPPKKDRQRRGGGKADVREYHFYMTLKLEGSTSSKRTNTRLSWETYTYQMVSRKTGETTDSDVSFNGFKPFVFCPVRSYLNYTTSAI